MLPATRAEMADWSRRESLPAPAWAVVLVMASLRWMVSFPPPAEIRAVAGRCVAEERAVVDGTSDGEGIDAESSDELGATKGGAADEQGVVVGSAKHGGASRSTLKDDGVVASATAQVSSRCSTADVDGIAAIAGINSGGVAIDSGGGEGIGDVDGIAAKSTEE